MSYFVKIKARPNQPVHFPPLCAHCTQAAGGKMAVKRRIGRVTRMVDVPVCKACQYELRRRSGKEEQLYKLGWLVSGILFLLAIAIMLLFTPSEFGFGLRLLLSATAAFLLATAVFALFHHASSRAELPEKQAIRHAVQIANFSWRATTFEFMNKTFANQFRAINEARLMEI